MAIVARPQLGLDPGTIAALIGVGGQLLGGAMAPGPDPNAAILRYLADRDSAKRTLTYLALGLGAVGIVAAVVVLRRR